MTHWLLAVVAVAMLAAPALAAEGDPRGAIPQATAPVRIDGRLTEWGGAFAAPVNAGHPDWQNRAAVWSFLWDDEALYIGLRALDQTIFNADPGPLYNGDGVELYVDARSGDALGGQAWERSTLHMFYGPASNGEIKARWQIRQGIPAFADLTLEGLEVASAAVEGGYELELKLPWRSFSDFTPRAGARIGLDCELCSSDGGPRIDRGWIFSGVEAVQTPSVIGRMELVDRLDPAEAARRYAETLLPATLTRDAGPAALTVAISPTIAPLVRRVEVLAGERRLPFTVLKTYGPGWRRVQTGLVGFLREEDGALTVRLLGEGDALIAERLAPLR